ncbi:MAG TPA: NADH-quinone oxidoreductase subunit N [Burkholderiaceae bacterium]|nr:NADH-quinone oxidoreductase subunit N [Burkholderiaceae bacterium]
MNLVGADLLALLPLLVLSGSSVVVMLVAAFWRRPAAVMGFSLLGLVLSFIALPLAASAVPRQVTPLLTIDAFALFYMGLVFAATFVVVILAYAYYNRAATPHEALYVLLLLAALGSAVLVASSHFASFVLGLELLSVSLFALIAYPRETERPLEAGIKYLILAGVSSAFLLFGMALVYAEFGSMAFGAIGALVARGSAGGIFLLAGLAMILVGIGFKLALVPFHMWTPDVYQGAPAPVTAFVATVSKGAMLALLLRYFVATGGYRSATIVLALTAIAVASILAGNLLALQQDNVKRILAYSSIAHLGYLLVAFLAAGALAIEAVSYYLVAYFVMMLGAFGVVGLLSPGGLQPDTERLDDYRGLFWHRPWVAGVFTAMLLSLAGIPLTMGFVAKFYVVTAGVGAQLWLLVVILVVGSAIGLFYYLRIIAAMCERVPEPGAVRLPAIGGAGGWTLTVLTVLLLWLGIAPAPLIELLRQTVALL